MNTIAIIDDDYIYREGIMGFLELETYVVIEADNGLTGLQVIRDYAPDLILCDVEMPLMNGIKVLQAIKADPYFAHIPFVLISGNSDNQILIMAQNLGVQAYLIKPITMTKLLTTINHFLNASA